MAVGSPCMIAQTPTGKLWFPEGGVHSQSMQNWESSALRSESDDVGRGYIRAANKPLPSGYWECLTFSAQLQKNFCNPLWSWERGFLEPRDSYKSRTWCSGTCPWTSSVFLHRAPHPDP